MNPHRRRLSAALEATRRVADRLRSSLSDDGDALAAAIEAEEDRLGLDLLRVLDSFVQRFQQTHEQMTRRLFPALYRAEEAGSRAPPLAALLDWIEGLGLVPRAHQWFDIAETRNRLVHEYPLAPADRRRALGEAVAQSQIMLDTLERVLAYLDVRGFPEIDRD